jgi:lipooligosaccharide transport system ATP-binding protein
LTIVIEARDLRKTYGDVQALKGISFSIAKGECFGFLGHNGAGKSTTMRMLYGLSSVEHGWLRLLGEQIHLTPPHVKCQLGVVPQEDNLDPDLSVMENLQVYGGFFGLSYHQARERGLELLSFMGLSGKEKANVEELSGGLKRRLVIARALMNRPSIIILDEPTTGLDPQARRLVWQKLRLLKAEGVTLILTTHYMEEATQLCDRLVIMHEGEVLAEGSPAELVAQHAQPYVVEVHLPTEQIPPDIAEKVAQLGGEAVQMANGLFLFTREGEALWQRLAAIGLPQHACYLRTAHLEDVYLKLTGRGDEAE